MQEQKKGQFNEIGHSHGGASTKIHVAVDSYGYPIFVMISEGQCNDIDFAIPLLEHIPPEGSRVLANRGYDSNQLIIFTIMEQNQRFHLGKEQSSGDALTGGNTKKDI